MDEPYSPDCLSGSARQAKRVESGKRRVGLAASFGGTRRLLHASIDEHRGQVRLIFDGAADDDAPRRALALSAGVRAAGLIGPMSSAALAIAPTVEELPVLTGLSTSLRAVARMAHFGTRRYHPAAAAKEAVSRIEHVKVDSSKWQWYRDWFLAKKACGGAKRSRRCYASRSPI